jgi:hypothetical protein
LDYKPLNEISILPETGQLLVSEKLMLEFEAMLSLRSYNEWNHSYLE